MRHSISQHRRAFLFVMALGGGLIYAANAAEELPLAAARPEPVETPTQESPSHPYHSDPKRFVGPEACMECHKAEYVVWSRSNHAKNAYDLLRTSSNAKQYAEKLGLNEDRVAHEPRCLACHSAPQSHTGKQTGLVLGVTCESCHNASGGEDGWLNAHATYGRNVRRRENESFEHRLQRIDRCRSAGQFRSDDLYSLARRCYECHIVGDEELVVRGGHHPGNTGFEMTSWFDKQIRHNLFLNPRHNGLAPSLWVDPHWRPDQRPGEEIDHRRLMYVVAMLVDLEISLQNRGRAEHASYAASAATRVVAASARLAQIAEDDSAEVLKPALEAIEKLEATLFSPPENEDAQSFLDAAELIKNIAKKISAEDRGEQFAAADRFLETSSK